MLAKTLGETNNYNSKHNGARRFTILYVFKKQKPTSVMHMNVYTLTSMLLKISNEGN